MQYREAPEGLERALSEVQRNAPDTGKAIIDFIEQQVSAATEAVDPGDRGMAKADADQAAAFLTAEATAEIAAEVSAEAAQEATAATAAEVTSAVTLLGRAG